MNCGGATIDTASCIAGSMVGEGLPTSRNLELIWFTASQQARGVHIGCAVHAMSQVHSATASLPRPPFQPSIITYLVEMVVLELRNLLFKRKRKAAELKEQFKALSNPTAFDNKSLDTIMVEKSLPLPSCLIRRVLTTCKRD